MDRSEANAFEPALPFLKARTDEPLQKRRRSQIACIHCNRRRARCNAATIGLPCTACSELGFTDCQFIESKRRYAKKVRQTTPTIADRSQASPASATPAPKSHDSIAASNSASAPAVQQSHQSPFKAASHESSELSPTKLAESETWTKAANVVSLSNQAGDVSVAYLGGSWVLPDVSERGKEHSAVQSAKRWSPSRAIPPPFELSLCLHLVSAFVDKFLQIFPIVDRQDFEDSVRSKTLPPVLLDAVFLAGAMQCDRTVLESAGFHNRMEAIQILYDRASATLDAPGKAETLVLVQCMFIMQFCWMSPTHWKDTKFWLSAAIRQAQMLGLQKESEIQKVKAPKQNLCRRIWWCLYIRDRQSAVAMGLPVLIQDQDCNVEEPSLEHLEDSMKHEAKLSFIHLVKLMKNVNLALQTEFGPASQRFDHQHRESRRQDIESSFKLWQAEIPPQLRRPSELSDISVFHLHLSFYTQIIMFHRSIVSDQDVESIVDVNYLIAGHAAGMVTSIATRLAELHGPESVPYGCIYSLLASTTVQLVRYRAQGVRDASGLEKVSANLRCLQKMEDIYPMAGWVRRLLLRASGACDERSDNLETQDISQNMDGSSYNRPMSSVTRLRYPQNTFMHYPIASDPVPIRSFVPIQNMMDRGSITELPGHRVAEPRPTAPGINLESAPAQDLEAYLMSCYAEQSSADNGASSAMLDDDWQDMYNQMGLQDLA